MTDDEVIPLSGASQVGVPGTAVARDGTPGRPIRVGWWFDALLVAGFAGLTAALVWWPPLLRLDLAVRDWCDAHRPPPAHIVGLVLDHLGQGGPLMTITLVVAFVLAWRLRSVRPILPAGVAPIVVTVAIVALKRWTERGSPHHGPVQMFSGPGYVEYPSGHVQNGVVYYLLGLLVIRQLARIPWATLPLPARLDQRRARPDP